MDKYYLLSFTLGLGIGYGLYYYFNNINTKIKTEINDIINTIPKNKYFEITPLCLKPLNLKLKDEIKYIDVQNWLNETCKKCRKDKNYELFTIQINKLMDMLDLELSEFPSNNIPTNQKDKLNEFFWYFNNSFNFVVNHSGYFSDFDYKYQYGHHYLNLYISNSKYSYLEIEKILIFKFRLD
jgi:hypothetical protein